MGIITSGILAITHDWYIEIYESMYRGQIAMNGLDLIDSAKTFLESNSPFASAATFQNLILMTGIALTIVYFALDYGDELANRQVGAEALMRNVLKLIIAVAIMRQLGTSLGSILYNAGNSVSEAMSAVTPASVGQAINESRFREGLADNSDMGLIVYVLLAIVPYLLCAANDIIITLIGISRVVEFTVRSVFVPIAIADIYRGGLHSPGMRYMKKIFALGLQMAIMMGISMACAQLINNPAISTNSAEELYENLVTIGHYSPDACAKFIQNLLDGDWALRGGIMAARIGLTIKSLALCNDIVGA